jgi:hypothetical protein
MEVKFENIAAYNGKLTALTLSVKWHDGDQNDGASLGKCMHNSWGRG